MNDLRRHFLVQALAWMAMPVFARGGTPLRVAVHPYNSTLALVATYRPLVRHLEDRLGREVDFHTAPSFDAFLATLLAGEYDLAICPPHFAVLAIERGYRPLANYRARLEPILAVPVASPMRTLTDARGRRLAMADRLALIRIAMLRRLEENGLIAGRDYQIVEVQTHGAAVAAATLGEVDAGLTTTTAFRQAPADVRARLRAIPSGLSLPHLISVAHPRLGDTLLKALDAALFGFEATVEGREFFGQTGFEGYERIGRDELAVLRPYVDIYRRMTGR